MAKNTYYCNECGADLSIVSHAPDCAELPDQDAIEAREEYPLADDPRRELPESGYVRDEQPEFDANEEEPMPYEVINLKTDESHGRYATIDDAKGCVAYDHLDNHFAIWHDTRGRVVWCDEYEGDDDRVKQGLGQPNASDPSSYMKR